MEEHVINSIVSFINEINNNVDDIYESLMDGEFSQAVKDIDVTLSKLRELKENINKKEE